MVGKQSLGYVSYVYDVRKKTYLTSQNHGKINLFIVISVKDVCI